MSNTPGALTNWQPTIPVDQGIYEESTTQKTMLGAQIVLGETKYAYAQAGTNLVPGNVLVSLNNSAINKSTVGAAVVAGTYEVPVYSATDLAANLFADSYLLIMDSAGEGYTYRIKKHPAITATTAGQMITLYDPIEVALATATKIAVVRNPFTNLVSGTDVTATSVVWGVSPTTVTSGNYFWAAVEGVAPVKAVGALTYGNKIVAGTTGGGTTIDATANATNYFGVCITLTGTAADTVLARIRGAY